MDSVLNDDNVTPFHTNPWPGCIHPDVPGAEQQSNKTILTVIGKARQLFQGWEEWVRGHQTQLLPSGTREDVQTVDQNKSGNYILQP